MSIQLKYVTMVLILGYIIPSVIVISSYCYVMKRVNEVEKNVLAHKTKSVGQDLKQTLIIFFIATCISILPEVVFRIIRIFNIPIADPACNGLRDASECFLLLLPVFNAILYSFLGTKFRQEMFTTPICGWAQQRYTLSGRQASLRSTQYTRVPASRKSTLSG